MLIWNMSLYHKWRSRHYLTITPVIITMEENHSTHLTWRYLLFILDFILTTMFQLQTIYSDWLTFSSELFTHYSFHHITLLQKTCCWPYKYVLKYFSPKETISYEKPLWGLGRNAYIKYCINIKEFFLESGLYKYI